MKLPGIHNQQNALVASAIAQIMGADTNDIKAVLTTFAGAKHRLQYDDIRGAQNIQRF